MRTMMTLSLSIVFFICLPLSSLGQPYANIYLYPDSQCNFTVAAASSPATCTGTHRSASLQSLIPFSQAFRSGQSILYGYYDCSTRDAITFKACTDIECTESCQTLAEYTGDVRFHLQQVANELDDVVKHLFELSFLSIQIVIGYFMDADLNIFDVSFPFFFF